MKINKIHFTTYYLFLIYCLFLFSHCKKEEEQPVQLETYNITSVTATTAQGGGRVFFHDDKQILARGICWDTTRLPTIESSHTVDGRGNGHFSSVLNGLLMNCKYYVRTYAQIDSTIHYGNTISFDSYIEHELISEIIIDSVVYGIAYVRCKSNYPIDSPSDFFVICVGFQPNTTTNNRFYKLRLQGEYYYGSLEIVPGVKHYLRPAIKYNHSSLYGKEIDYTPADSNHEQVTDIDGNSYRIIQIGKTQWFGENLKTTRLNDGISISLITNDITWYFSNINPSFCWYQNDVVQNKEAYGALYNWYAVSSGKLCPQGWSIPSVQDWEKLISIVGSSSMAGGMLKATGTIEAGTGLWSSPNQGAINLLGFSVVPAGGRFAQGKFLDIGDKALFWTGTLTGYTNVWIFGLDYRKASIDKDFCDYNKKYGLSVRCVKGVH